MSWDWSLDAEVATRTAVLVMLLWDAFVSDDDCDDWMWLRELELCVSNDIFVIFGIWVRV